METYLICLAAALVGGLLLTRVTKLMHLPAVTAYLVAGLLLGPFCIGRLGLPGLGFNSLEQVEALQVLTQTALGFIAFTIGNEFRLGQLKAMGKSAIVIGILQAVITTLLVDAILVGLHMLRPDEDQVHQQRGDHGLENADDDCGLAHGFELAQAELIADGEGDEAQGRLGQNAQGLHLRQGVEAQAGQTQGADAEGAKQQACHQIGGDSGQMHQLGHAGQHQAADHGSGKTEKIGFHNIPSLITV